MLLRPAASQPSRRLAPVGVSLTVHMGVLAAVAFGPAGSGKRVSDYRREIAPHEKKLVWYRFNDKLPDVSPPKPEAAEPVRAELKNPQQTIVSRSPRNDPAKQMTLAPAPELKVQPELAAPNLMAFEAPKPPPPPKLFAPPEPVPRPVEQVELDAAPEVAVADTQKVLAGLPAPRVLKLPPRAFVPPATPVRKTDAPELQPGELRIEMAPLRPTPLPQLPAAPKMQARAFTAPSPAPKPVGPTPSLAAAPALNAAAPKTTLLAGVQTQLAAAPKMQPKPFTPPPGQPTRSTPAPLESAPQLSANLTAAVVGMNPVDRPMPVIPEVSRPAQFSAAPEISRTGGAGAPAETTTIVVPGLTIRSGEAPRKQPQSIATLARVAPTSRENLLAAVRPSTVEFPALTPPKASATRVAAGPDPRFEGRVVYTVALQMANVTSYSGSWILWYAERERRPGEAAEISAPNPLRKVDPIYDLSAVDERVEGKVQLSAVIHTDGYVYGINVLSGLDPRLDKNAVAALRKWEFEPARRDGAPVDVDVVIEIPFRLKPRK